MLRYNISVSDDNQRILALDRTGAELVLGDSVRQVFAQSELVRAFRAVAELSKSVTKTSKNGTKVIEPMCSVEIRAGEYDFNYGENAQAHSFHVDGAGNFGALRYLLTYTLKEDDKASTPFEAEGVLHTLSGRENYRASPYVKPLPGNIVYCAKQPTMVIP